MTKKILIIDDDRIFSKILRDGIITGGMGKYEVVSAFDGEEGLTVAEKEKPDLVMLDLVMPKLGGIETLKKLRAEEWGKDIPVIVETQLSDIVSMGEGIALGVRGYFVKTDYSLEDILKQISDVIG
jgi:DNA-binding NarL/FixJ family response regulator